MTEDVKEVEELTNEAIQKLFDERKQANLQKCENEINAVLSKYGCRMQPVTVIQDGKIATKINIVGN